MGLVLCALSTNASRAVFNTFAADERPLLPHAQNAQATHRKLQPAIVMQL
jgi:hypothetical protein